MNDLTTGPIARHIVRMALPMAFGMLFQTAYLLIDLYFVAGLGNAALAGVSSAGTLQYIVMAVTQVLGVGTLSLIAQASGRRDRADATLVLNQSLFLSLIGGASRLLTLALPALWLSRQPNLHHATGLVAVSRHRHTAGAVQRVVADAGVPETTRKSDGAERSSDRRDPSAD